MQVEQLEILDFLAAHPPFDDLPEDVRERVAAAVDVRYYKAGEQIVEFGQAAEFWHVVRSGAVEVFRRNGTLYTGVTSDLHDRVWNHKLGTFKGFTDAYACKGLVWFEPQAGMVEAIRREKQIKKWPRQWKLNLIEAGNPQWEDLAASWFD